jgi:hypothetical protein
MRKGSGESSPLPFIPFHYSWWDRNYPSSPFL